MAPRLFLPLVVLAIATLQRATSAATFEYTNLRRDFYINLIGQKSSFDGEGQAALKSALDAYGSVFAQKFTDCFTEFNYGEITTMSKPEWTVYSQDKQYVNDENDGYLQQVKWNVGKLVLQADQDLDDMMVSRCARRAFNFGKSEFVPLLDSAAMFSDVEKAKVLSLDEFTPPPAADDETTGETDATNDLLADSELIQGDGVSAEGTIQDPIASPTGSPTKVPTTKPLIPDVPDNNDSVPAQPTDQQLSKCPVKLRVDCTTPDGKTDCNDMPRPSFPDCKQDQRVKYSYYMRVEEEIRFQSATRYRKNSFLGCGNEFGACPVREYMTDLKNKYVRVGTELDAWELVCEDTRHDTLFVVRAQRETYFGSHEWVDCIITDDYEDDVWANDVKKAYLDLLEKNKVILPESVETDEPTMTPTSSPSSGPTMPPTVSPTGSPESVSPTAAPVKELATQELDAETVTLPEDKRCTQLALSIACSTLDGTDCNDVPQPAGTVTDPCTVDVKYKYSIKNIGNTGPAEFSKLMRMRTRSSDIDFLPYFGQDPFVLAQTYSAYAASMTETTSVDFCEPETHVTVLVAESTTARGGECNTVEEYLLIPPVAIPGLDDLSGGDETNEANTEMTEISQDFDIAVGPGEVSKEASQDVVTVSMVGEDGGETIALNSIANAATSSGCALTSFIGSTVVIAVSCCLYAAA
mmetsp:Transcript_7748/g.15621  ORF Transcript_7748/g.15621 Transcript_7748/m.15621 type:complete len:694 (+) Transcript_7748:292-2373(+)